MPYVEQYIRDQIDADTRTPLSAGELNYKFCTDIIRYVHERGMSYQTFNDIVGALEGAKAEFQRRVVEPYEDAKILKNGDLNWGGY